MDFVVAPNVEGEAFDGCSLIENRDVGSEGELEGPAGMRGVRESKDGEETDGFFHGWCCWLLGFGNDSVSAPGDGSRSIAIYQSTRRLVIQSKSTAGYAQ